MGEMRLAPVVKGLLTFVPGLHGLMPSKRTGRTDSARYSYGLWLKHITLLHVHGLRQVPETMAELGPGEAIGLGLCALLSGAHRYIGLDVVAHSNIERNRRVLQDLIPLFQQRAPRPDKGWPDFDAHLDGNLFPSGILREDRLEQALQPDRLASIRAAIEGQPNPHGITAEYKAPWSDPAVVIEDSIELVMSHSVLEHVVDLAGTYRTLYRWLKPGGWMSHQIDLRCHGLSKRWNGFRTCSDRVWNMAVGGRPYMINRQPVSVHLRLIQEAGFDLVAQQKFLRTDGIRREELALRWKDITEEDLNCSGVYVIARKPG